MTIEIKTHYGSYVRYDIEQSRMDELINYYEDQWDYVRVTDGEKVIYETDGYERH